MKSNNIILLTIAALILTVVPATAFADLQTYQQTSFNKHCTQGWTDGENAAYTDWNNNMKFLNQSCTTDQSNTYDYYNMCWDMATNRIEV
jgi:hypothetical protein